MWPASGCSSGIRTKYLPAAGNLGGALPIPANLGHNFRDEFLDSKGSEFQSVVLAGLTRR